MGAKMVLVDGNSLMHRAFHALPLLDDGAGVYTNAVFGFLSMLFKVLRDEQPQYLAVAFDLHGPTFRHESYEEYKAGRQQTPEELRPQFDLLRELLSQMHVEQVSLARYEADDMLGTLSRKCEPEGVEALLVTGDRDAFQLAGEHTAILYTKRGITDTERVTPAYLKERYGLTPEQMIDLKGLMGDSSDNIPGIPGVGEKTALKLLGEYGTLEEVLERGAREQKGKLREKLAEFADQARFSKKLATIECDAPVDFSFDVCRIRDMADGTEALKRYKLKSLAQRLGQLPPWMLGLNAPGEAPQDAGETRVFTPPVQIADEAGLIAWAASQDAGDGLALSLDGASVALTGGAQAEIALGGGDLLTPGLDEAGVARALAPLLLGGGQKVVCGVKRLLHLMPQGARPNGEVFDVMLAAYARNPQEKSYASGDLLGQENLSPDAQHTGAALLWTLRDRQEHTLREDGLWNLYREIELPLAYALFDMEQAGFLVDDQALREMGALYQARIANLQKRVQEMAGEPFNLNSPKQLGDLLFGKLGLSGGKKTGKGWSTTAEILESVADQHEIVPLMLEYRKYFKLNSTYVEALLRLRGPDGRIHTLFDQTATATGRISSNEPNLQNIPVRTEEGKQIRLAFVAAPGNVLVDADYSQIELRVLAHMSGDERLCEAFRLGQDIHRRTAAEVYGVPLEEVTPAMRSAAKAVNFGIVYGISDFGLARNIGVSRKEAAAFIERYFARYPQVRRYMDEQVTKGKTDGYVTTLFGRRRYLPELTSANYNTRSFGERVAMNSPIQGTAADIIKLAMIRAHDALRRQGLRAKLILQVHDELIVEAPEDEAERVCSLLREAMEGAAALSVPLKADLSMGRNWHECKA